MSENEQPNQPQAGEQYTPPEPNPAPQNNLYDPPQPPQPQEPQEAQAEQYTPPQPQAAPFVPPTEQYTPPQPEAAPYEPQAEQYTPPQPQAAPFVPPTEQYTPPQPEATQYLPQTEQYTASGPQAPQAPQPNQAAPQSRKAQANQPSAISPIVASFKNYFTLMVPLLTGYPEKILVKAYKDSKLWIIGIVFAALSLGLLGANGIGAIISDVSNRLSMGLYGFIPMSFDYGFFKWLTIFIVFAISGALFVALRALALWLSTIVMGQQGSFKDCLNLAAFTYSWMFALNLLTSFLVILSLGFTSLTTLLAIPIVIACELFTFTGLQTMGEFKRSPIVAYAIFIGCAYILSGLITWLLVHGVLQ